MSDESKTETNEEAKTLREQFPEASVSALWGVVERLAGAQLACARPLDGTVDCPTRYRGLSDRSDWCSPCLVRADLQHSHEYQEQQRLYRPAPMKPGDPGMTPRDELLCAAASVAEAWKTGEGPAIGRANGKFYHALDAYEYGAEEQWEELARGVVRAPVSTRGAELRDMLRVRFQERTNQLTIAEDQLAQWDRLAQDVLLTGPGVSGTTARERLRSYLKRRGISPR